MRGYNHLFFQRFFMYQGTCLCGQVKFQINQKITDIIMSLFVVPRVLGLGRCPVAFEGVVNEWQ